MTDALKIALRVNGKSVSATVEPRHSLAHFLREELDLTGTHLGCEHGACGACSVLMDGVSVRSCLIFAVQANATEITTVEGLSPEGELTPLQQAFRRHHALQCGFCTPGQLITAHELLRDNPDPTADEVRHAMSGNICRCTGYTSIVEAILDAAAQTRAVKELL